MAIAAGSSFTFRLSGAFTSSMKNKKHSANNVLVFPRKSSYVFIRCCSTSSHNNPDVTSLQDTARSLDYESLRFEEAEQFQPYVPPHVEETLAIKEGLTDDSKMMELFEDWMRKHNRFYATAAEKDCRFKLFKAFAEKVYDDNTSETRSWVSGLTKFADYSDEDIDRVFNAPYNQDP